MDHRHVRVEDDEHGVSRILSRCCYQKSRAAQRVDLIVESNAAIFLIWGRKKERKQRSVHRT